MRNRGEVVDDGPAKFKLSNTFKAALESNLPPSFKYEELLVWLLAFKGFPDHVQSWSELDDYLRAHILELATNYAPEFLGRFNLRPAEEVGWPTEILSSRPENDEFQALLAPSLNAPERSNAATDTIDHPSINRIIAAIETKDELNFLLYGPPGTGKTYLAHKFARMMTEGNEDRVLFLQFHPSMSYDDFVEGYVPRPTAGGMAYEPEPRHFLKLCEKARANPDDRYVVLIDEISRADPSRVLGELLTYIENDYRENEFSLAYSGKKVSIPSNVIIVATTNPYDRSVSELDDALIRRFYMVEIAPNRVALEEHLNGAGLHETFTGKLLHLFDILNAAFPHGFGHSHFYGVASEDEMQDLWESKFRFMIKRSFIRT